MINNIPKISIMVITYNQENIITRTIESLLVQRDYIYEICVSDDCSKDNTWNILNKYYTQYPGLLKLNRNDQNLGIFGNIEKSWEMPTGDLVYRLAGDDQCSPIWFKTICNYIIENNIDYKNELCCFYGNYKILYPNGDSLIRKNNMVTSGINLIRLYERGIIVNTSSCFSIKILKKFQKVSQGKSYIVENCQDCQLHYFTEKAYYINEVGSYYYAQIGVSSHMSPEVIKQHEGTMICAFEYLQRKGYLFDKRDKYLPQKNIAKKRFIRNRSLTNLIVLLLYTFRCFDSRIFLSELNIKSKIFTLMRRLPHKNKLEWIA